LNITKDGVFSDYIFVLTLPEGPSINYIKSSGSIRIEEDFGKLIVKGFGQGNSLSVIVQYQVEKATGSIEATYIAILSTIMVVGLIVVFLAINRVLKRRLKEKRNSETEEGKTGHGFSGLSDRQKEIMKLLIEEKRPLTQTAIQKELNIPKAAVSRNISSLELKGLVEKEKIGMSNLIRLKKS
ncbi:MAG: winged helix-turn-helix transcriptional regulator, partial [Thermoplasmatales archaeon]|nr:winged helix-turn-helix transcriptional regulator [Thermoplasmatales archaeon]